MSGRGALGGLAAALAGVSFLLSAAPLHAQAEVHPLQRRGAPLFALCNNLVSATRAGRAGEESGPEFEYQEKIYLAAGVRRGDPPETRRERVQRFWREQGQFLTCEGRTFLERQPGNLIKFCISLLFTNCIDDLVVRWAVDPNRIDAADGRTALDFVEAEMERIQHTPSASTLRLYHDRLRRIGGARHRREIDGIDCTHWPDTARMDRRCPRAAR